MTKQQIKSEPLEKAIEALVECYDFWFHEVGTYVLTPEYIKEKERLISIMKSMLIEAGELEES